MTDFRSNTLDFLSGLIRATQDDARRMMAQHLTPDSTWHLAHPVNGLTGPDAIFEGFIQPLQRALAHVHRRDEIFIGGRNIRHEHGLWTASVTHYVGNFVEPLFGVPASDRLVFLRSGEFYRLDDDGRIAEARIIFDLPDLMRQAGCFPLPRELGTEMLFPGPATHDGVLPQGGDGAGSLAVVEGMLADLHHYDPVTASSYRQTGDDGYWHDDMLWYGPGGIGSSFRWSGFVKDHRAAFLTAFPDRKGGNHYCRIGDGHYAAVSGWPSMTMTHSGRYLGVAPTGRALTLRVMDFYRCAGGKIRENWVCLDYGDLFQQMGVDLIAEAQALSAAAAG